MAVFYPVLFSHFTMFPLKEVLVTLVKLTAQKGGTEWPPSQSPDVIQGSLC